MNRSIKIVVALMLVLAVIAVAFPVSADSSYLKNMDALKNNEYEPFTVLYDGDPVDPAVANVMDDSYQRNLEAMETNDYDLWTVLHEGIITRLNEICKGCNIPFKLPKILPDIDVTPPDNTDIPDPVPTPPPTEPPVEPTPLPTEPPV